MQSFALARGLVPSMLVSSVDFWSRWIEGTNPDGQCYANPGRAYSTASARPVLHQHTLLHGETHHQRTLQNKRSYRSGQIQKEIFRS
jgi:hypothetical protein